MSRRKFLKATAIAVGSLVAGAERRGFAAWPRKGTMDINPSVGNTRVAACQDRAMLRQAPTEMTFDTVNRQVDAARVHADMDAMAMRLAGTTSPDKAWRTLLRSSRAWPSTIVAIKVNVTEPKNVPHLAVLETLCRTFVGFGVPASNIIVYHGGTQAYAGNIASYRPHFSTTDGAKIPGIVSNGNDALGGTAQATLPDGTTHPCTADIANGKVDILVNVAVNKGHPFFGRATLCMKNHFGTFPADYTDTDNYIVNINKSDAILGGAPPRQQLCIVDSLVANKVSSHGTPEAMPCYLVMGTFAPVVDYLTVKKIRESVMGASHDDPVVESYLTRFGYAAKDATWLVVPPVGSPAR